MPTKVKGRARVDELFPAASDTYLIWSQNSIARPRRYNAWVEPLDRSVPATKMNAPGSVHGFTGSTVNGDEAMFQEVTAGARFTKSNIYLFDVATKVRSDPPDGVNTRYWEWSPSSSPGYILFGRNRFATPTSPWQVVLHDRGDGTETILDSVRNRCGCIYPGNVTDSYATWAKCVTTCQAWYHDIVAGTTQRIANPLDRQQYSPAVSGDSSSIYFVRSGNACGANVKLMRWDIGGGDPVVVSSLADGLDIYWSPGVFTDGDGHDHVYFGQLACDSFYGDIYVADDAETASVASTAGAAGVVWKAIARPDARS